RAITCSCTQDALMSGSSIGEVELAEEDVRTSDGPCPPDGRARPSPAALSLSRPRSPRSAATSAPVAAWAVVVRLNAPGCGLESAPVRRGWRASLGGHENGGAENDRYVD